MQIYLSIVAELQLNQSMRYGRTKYIVWLYRTDDVPCSPRLSSTVVSQLLLLLCWVVVVLARIGARRRGEMTASARLLELFPALHLDDFICFICLVWHACDIISMTRRWSEIFLHCRPFGQPIHRSLHECLPRPSSTCWLLLLSDYYWSDYYWSDYYYWSDWPPTLLFHRRQRVE